MLRRRLCTPPTYFPGRPRSHPFAIAVLWGGRLWVGQRSIDVDRRAALGPQQRIDGVRLFARLGKFVIFFDVDECLSLKALERSL